MRKYVRPELDVLEFDVDDVITVSSFPNGSGGSNDPGGSDDPGGSGEPNGSEWENAYSGAGGFDNTPPGGYF